MPLPVIADIAAKPPGEAAEAVGRYWAGVESVMADRRVLIADQRTAAPATLVCDLSVPLR